MPTNRFCQICYLPIDRYTFPTIGNRCVECEYTYGIDTTRRVDMMANRNKDYISAIRHSGNFPLTFNFVLFKDGHHIQCAFCGKFINAKRITRDHIYPKSKGGIIKVPACRPCNEAKEDMLPIDFGLWWAKEGRDIPTIPIGYNEEIDDP